MIRLAAPTDPKWVKVILDNFDEFLIDHADCERKASATAMTFVAKCPDRVHIAKPLINLALEELRHFKQVYLLMEKRGLRLNAKMIEDPYVSRLMALCRTSPDDRFLDRMLIMSVVETRGAERFGILYPELEDPELKTFYRQLYLAETKHGNVFVNLARKYFDASEITGRLELFLEKEAELVAGLPWRPSLH
jgi:tRNA-(ms[2]io[6]A)-hydroxylase